VAAVNPIWLWVVLTLASVAVGGTALWIAFAAVNRRQREQQGFEVKTTAAGGDPAALREKDTDHG
jgi:hypothetical protein